MRGAALSRSSRRSRTRVIWVITALIGLLLTTVQPAGAAPDDKSYTVHADAIDPDPRPFLDDVPQDRVCTSDTVTVTFTFTNTSTTSTQRMRGAQVTAPSAYSSLNLGGLSQGVITASGGQQWIASVSGNTVTLIADNEGTGTDQGIMPQQSVSVAVTLTAPPAPLTGASADFTTVADQNANFGGGGNAFMLIGPKPRVSAVACELVLTAAPDPVFAGSGVTIDAEVVDSADADAGPVLSFSGDLASSTSPSGCSSPGTGTTAISAGAGSFTLLALFGDSADLCTVNGSVKTLSDSVTFEVEGSAADCKQNTNCQTGTEVSADSVTFAYVFCENCKNDTILVADYLEDRCINEDCKALFLADSSTADVPFFIDITVTGIPRGQVTIVADLGAGLVEVGSCSKRDPQAPCIFSISGSGSTNTWRVLLATDPPIGVR